MPDSDHARHLLLVEDEPALRDAVGADALVIVTDVYTWKLLRRDMGRSAAATQATLEQLMDGVTAQFFGRDPGGK